VVLDVSGLKPGDVAGLALLNKPFAWIGVERDRDGVRVTQHDEKTGKAERKTINATRIWLRADCDFLTEKSTFSYSLDGKKFDRFGIEFTSVFQLTTFQGVRYTLFAYNTLGAPGDTPIFRPSRSSSLIPMA